MGETLSYLLLTAWLLPLVSFVLIIFFGKRMGRAGIGASYVATGAILGSMILSLISLFFWLDANPLGGKDHHGEKPSHVAAADSGTLPVQSASVTFAADEDHDHDDGAAENDDAAASHASSGKVSYSGEWYSLAQFGDLKLSIGYYIDALTIIMFVMVTIIASCIHFYAIGYMHDELHEFTDPEVTLENGEKLKRPGRFPRFFQSMSLFCFSMLGIVISGNLMMTFIFWELVGICSYFLIGFYIERKSASTAANKAFIVNRVGDFGMIIGLMALFGALGTVEFDQMFNMIKRGDPTATMATDHHASHIQTASVTTAASGGHDTKTVSVIAPDGMVVASAHEEVAKGWDVSQENIGKWRDQGHGYWLLVIAGLGIFCGCVGKSAQFPLHVWLPDAMEGPTPVSALVHSATMVAAGVFLVGRFYPMFVPEVLLVIAVLGCITLFMAATIAMTATDIKRVLAYSTLSQLGYMMFALGLGGWVAGMLHLITHAFFKSLLFMCSGSVIHAVHSNEMTDMGGLRKKMPITAYTMLIGCLAISGVGIPMLVGFSGYYSKDAILAQVLNFRTATPFWGGMAVIFILGAAITAFYMFRLWFMTFAGPPRDEHRYDHAHESPRVMTWPLIVLAVFAVFVAMPPLTSLTDPSTSPLVQMLVQAEPVSASQNTVGVLLPKLTVPSEHASHAPDIHLQATTIATLTWLLGIGLAVVIYGKRWISAAEAKATFLPIYTFLRNKWWFDELYDFIWVRPLHLVSGWVAAFDKRWIDGLIHAIARGALAVSRFDDFIDRCGIDGFVNWFARRTFNLGLYLRRVQTGRLRQYVVFIVVGTVALFVVASFLIPGS